MNITFDKVTKIFYLTDEFCKEFKPLISTSMIGNDLNRSHGCLIAKL